MNITELGYMVVSSTDPATWQSFAVDQLGAMATTTDDGVYVRLDELKYRILVLPGERDEFVSAGWVTVDQKTFEANIEAARQAGLDVHVGTEEECAVRAVANYFSFSDPSGNTHEVCWGRTQVAEPFVSTAGMSEFVTGALGFGHVVLPCHPRYDESLAFYSEIFGFAASDFFRFPTESGPGPRVTFLHPDNARQHSLAIADAPVEGGLSHVMLEVKSLDDVGRAMDRAQAAGLVRRSLGRHVNDGMVSFYLESPTGFLVEYGYDGLEIEWEGHEVRQIPQGSYWGHRWV